MTTPCPNVDYKTAAEVEREAKELQESAGGPGTGARIRCTATVGRSAWHRRRVHGQLQPRLAQWAIDRTKRAIDIAGALGTRLMVLWLAREGTYIRESKNAIQAYQWQIDAINALLEHNPEIRVCHRAEAE